MSKSAGMAKKTRSLAVAGINSGGIRRVSLYMEVPLDRVIGKDIKYGVGTR